MDRRFGGAIAALVALGLATGTAARERAPRPMARKPMVSATLGQHRRFTGHIAYFTITARPTRYPPWPVRNFDARHELTAVEGYYWITRDDTGQMLQLRLGGSGGTAMPEVTDDQVTGRMAALFQAYRDGRLVTIDAVDTGGSLMDIVAVGGEAPSPHAAH